MSDEFGAAVRSNRTMINEEGIASMKLTATTEAHTTDPEAGR
jgi:hypothetical protein